MCYDGATIFGNITEIVALVGGWHCRLAPNPIEFDGFGNSQVR